MNSKVIYTTIFGEYDTLINPHFIDKGWDYICFTDNENLSLDTQSYLLSKNTVDNYEGQFRKLYASAQICGLKPDTPGCAEHFPNGMFNGKPLSPNTQYEVVDFFENFKQLKFH